MARERPSVTKNDMQLTWKLSDDIIIVLSFDCHDRLLSEILLVVSIFPLRCTEVDKIL